MKKVGSCLHLMTMVALLVPVVTAFAEIPAIENIDTDRELTYPPGYMRREPNIHRSSTADLFNPEGTILNIADLEMFRKKAEIKNTYHLSNDDAITITAESNSENKKAVQNPELKTTGGKSSVTKESDKESRVIFRALSR